MRKTCVKDVFEYGVIGAYNYPQFSHCLSKTSTHPKVIRPFHVVCREVLRVFVRRLTTAVFQFFPEIDRYLSTLSTPPTITTTIYINKRGIAS